MRLKQHSRSRRKSKLYHQKAGGDWTSFCAACGKPLSNGYLADYGLSDKSTRWMNENVGYDPIHELILTIGADDMTGACPIDPVQSDEMRAKLLATGINSNEFSVLGEGVELGEDVIGGPAFHEACLTVLENFGVNVTLEVAMKLYQRCTNRDYQGQEYEFELALEENRNHFRSPMVNKENALEILRGCRGAEEIEAAVQNELARRKRIINANRYARLTRKINRPMNIKGLVGSYLSSNSNTRRTNRYVPGKIQEFNEEAAAAAAAPAAALAGSNAGAAPAPAAPAAALAGLNARPAPAAAAPAGGAGRAPASAPPPPRRTLLSRFPKFW